MAILARQIIRRDGKSVGRIEETGRGAEAQYSCGCGFVALRPTWAEAYGVSAGHLLSDSAYLQFRTPMNGRQ